MKKILLICLLLVSISSFSQETRNTLTLKEIIFLGSFDNTNKIVQTSSDGKINRTLMKINTDNAEEPMLKYMLLENNEEGTAIGSSYILSKKAIDNETDFFKFNINSYDVIYNDPELIKANEENNGKNISIGLKHAGKPIDLGTIPDNYAIASCENGSAPYCIDWYWQTFENGILISEEYQYTTCKCGGGGGGNTGPGSGLSLSPEEQCENFTSNYSGNSLVQILESNIIHEGDYNKQLAWRTKIYTSSSGYGLASNDQATAYRENTTELWRFSSFTHNSITQIGMCIVPEIKISHSTDAQAADFLNLPHGSLKLNYTITTQCVLTNPAYTGQPLYDAKSVRIWYSANNDNSAILVVPLSQ